jgi:AraC-like DNA-binding protein
MQKSDSSPEAGNGNARDGRTLMDNSYVLGHHGFVYTSNRLPNSTTLRHPAALLISADYAPFRLTTADGVTAKFAAAMVPPRVERKLDGGGVPMLSFNIMPAHASYHVFQAMQKGGVRSLDRSAFNHLDAEFNRLLHGTADIIEAELVFSRVATQAQSLLPPAPPPDPRALTLIRMLDADPELGLDDLAQRLGYSRQVMSRMFSSAVGMSLRDYQNWLKQRRVYDSLYTQRSLTQVAYRAGFADSAHFTRAYLRWYGNTPSNARDPKQVRVFIHGGSNQPPSPTPSDQDET